MLTQQLKAACFEAKQFKASTRCFAFYSNGFLKKCRELLSFKWLLKEEKQLAKQKLSEETQIRVSSRKAKLPSSQRVACSSQTESDSPPPRNTKLLPKKKPPPLFEKFWTLEECEKAKKEGRATSGVIRVLSSSYAVRHFVCHFTCTFLCTFLNSQKHFL